MLRTLVIASVLGLAACGAEQTERPVDILSFDIAHGTTPNEYILSWETDPANANVTIEWSMEPDFQPGEGTRIDVTEAASELSWTAEGEEQRRYFAIIPSSGDAKVSAVRLLPLEGGRNFRDIGGYETEDGRSVKWGKVFRSGQMSGLTDSDYDYLSDLGISVICDFRDKAEREEEATDWRAGSIDYQVFSEPSEEDRLQEPMFAALLDPEATGDDVRKAMIDSYWTVVENEDEGYTRMFDNLAAGRLPLAFNCSAGKDRAGTAAALILTALGVPRETVVADYSLSDKYVDYMGEFLADKRKAAEVEESDLAYAFIFGLPTEKVAPLMASDPAYIEASFDKLEADHGSVLNFIQKELDVTDEELEQIRTNLLN